MKIYNDRYEVTFCELGGEITSFLDKQTNRQYMYQGDSPYWAGKNPTLFPIVGNTFSGTYEAKGKTYAFKNHGFIRTSILTCIKQEETSITFTLDANEDTLAVYPYVFQYAITYTLKDNTLEVVYTITNKDQETMPFTFGLHPGFSTSLVEGESYEDYTLSFECEEHAKQLIFDVNKENPHYYKDVVMKEIPLLYADMEKYATMIYKGLSSSYVTLKGKAGHGVKVSIAGYPFLAFWAPNQAPFVCIEPWYSHGDFEANTTPFESRVGMLSLEAGKHFVTSYTIEVF